MHFCAAVYRRTWCPARVRVFQRAVVDCSECLFRITCYCYYSAMFTAINDGLKAHALVIKCWYLTTRT